METDAVDLSKAKTFMERLGMVFDEASGDRVVATMPVEGNTQPDGFLHGGATMSLIESVASTGAALAAGWPDKLVVGLQQTCNFLATSTEGTARAVGTPVHKGRTTQVWDVEVRLIETDKLLAAGRVTLSVRERREQPPAATR